MKLSFVFLLLTGLVLALAEPRVPQRGVIHEIKSGVAGPNPFIFLSVPRGRSQSIVQGFEVVEDDEDEDEDVDETFNGRQKNSLANNQNDDDEEEDGAADDDDDLVDDQYANDDEEESENTSDEQMINSEGSIKTNVLMKNGQASQMMVSREHAGAIMVPDEIIEIEGQSVIDEKTGKPALLLPRSVLDSIPDGSVVALLEQPTDDISEERANRVIVRRRRKGSRRNVKRRRVNGNNNRRRRRRGGNRRRRVNNNRVRVVRVNGNRRRNVRRGGNRRRVVYQG